MKLTQLQVFLQPLCFLSLSGIKHFKNAASASLHPSAPVSPQQPESDASHCLEAEAAPSSQIQVLSPHFCALVSLTTVLWWSSHLPRASPMSSLSTSPCPAFIYLCFYY